MKKDIIKKGSIINTETGTIEVTYRNAGGLFAVIEREYDEDGEVESEREVWKTKDELEQAMKTMDGKNHSITWEGSDWADDQAAEMVGEGLFDAAVELMDDEIREEIHEDLAPCTDEEFLAEYIRRHQDKFGETFTV